MTSYLRARYVEEPPWDVVRDPWRDVRKSTALFLSWLPLLLSGARVSFAERRFSFGYLVHFKAIVPVLKIDESTPATCSCATWGWGGALCDVHRGSE